MLTSLIASGLYNFIVSLVLRFTRFIYEGFIEVSPEFYDSILRVLRSLPEFYENTSRVLRSSGKWPAFLLGILNKDEVDPSTRLVRSNPTNTNVGTSCTNPINTNIDSNNNNNATNTNIDSNKNVNSSSTSTSQETNTEPKKSRNYKSIVAQRDKKDDELIETLDWGDKNQPIAQYGNSMQINDPLGQADKYDRNNPYNNEPFMEHIRCSLKKQYKLEI